MPVAMAFISLCSFGSNPAAGSFGIADLWRRDSTSWASKPNHWRIIEQRTYVAYF
jgi:hypothetical protein